MENLVIFRMFLCFPLFGFLLPDAGMLLSKTPAAIPLAHFIVEATLLVFVIACSVRIVILKKRENILNVDKAPLYEL